MKALSILWVPLFVLSLSALAQTPPPAQPGSAAPAPAAPPRHGDAKQRFLDADGNGDGKLSRDEAQAMPRLAKHFDDVDGNRDGYITRDELRAAHARMKEARAKRQGQPPAGQATPPPDQGDDDGSH